MEHSIALVTGATSGLGLAAARLLAGEGWHEIIVTGSSVARIQDTTVRLAAETKTRVFTLELDLRRASLRPVRQVGSACSLRLAPWLLRPADRASSTDCRIAPFRT